MNTALRKDTYSNILKISQPKIEILLIKIPIVFIFLLKNIDCGRGGSNEYAQSMFLSINKKK